MVDLNVIAGGGTVESNDTSNASNTSSTSLHVTSVTIAITSSIGSVN